MAKYVFGVDVGGTTVKMGLFSADGNVMDKWEIPTRTENAGKEILPDIAESIRAKMAEKGYTLVPLQVYFKGSLVKVEVGLAKGKKLYDKRDDIAKKDQRREMEREFKQTFR